MKFLVVLFGIFGLFLLIFKPAANRIGIPQKSFKKVIGVGLLVIFILLLALVRYTDSLPDKWCYGFHTVSYEPPASLNSAMDYFNRGNYDYDRGDCNGAIADYTKSIAVDPTYPETFNNRGYTYTRMRNYKAALVDFTRAVELKPSYVNALMNLGDLYNYWGPEINRQKAIELYNKVIALGGDTAKSACGHKAMAENNNVLPLVLLRFLIHTNCQ